MLCPLHIGWSFGNITINLTIILVMMTHLHIVGIMLYELMRLETPFYKSDTTELVKSILNDPPPDLPTHYSSELRSFCSLFTI